jgi:hypothetical protein
MDEYWVIYSGGGCMLADLADRLGFDRFLGVLGDYAHEHWLGVARTAEFTAAIEAAMAADGIAFDADGYWSAWRVDRRA